MGITGLEKDLIIQHKLKQARDFESQGKYLHSIQIYHSLISEFPDLVHAYLNLAILYEHIGNLKSAEDTFYKIVSITPDDDEMKIYFAQFLMRKMDWTGVVNVLNDSNPENEPLASFLTGVSYMFLGEYELAKINFLNFVISDEQPELIYEAYLFLAKIELKLKQYENALKHIRRAETLFDDYWELYLLYAKVYFEQDMGTHSIDYLRKAVRKNGENPLIHYWAGKIYLKFQEKIKAEAHLNHYLDLIDETSAEDFMDKVKLFLKSGKLKEAFFNFEIADCYIEKKNFAIRAKDESNYSSEKLDGTDD